MLSPMEIDQTDNCVKYQTEPTNMDNCLDGITIVTSSSATNLPYASRGTMFTFTPLSAPLRKTQMFLAQTGTIHTRTYDGTAWSAWKAVQFVS